MSDRPNKTLMRLRAQIPLDEGENYIGGFMARTGIKWAFYFLIGPFAVFTMKQYQVMVTDKRVIFGKLSPVGTFTGFDHFSYNDIRQIALRKKILGYKITICFSNHQRPLVLNAFYKSARPMEGYLFDEKMGAFLQKAAA